jgi:hypothetical protein
MIFFRGKYKIGIVMIPMTAGANRALHSLTPNCLITCAVRMTEIGIQFRAGKIFLSTNSGLLYWC